MTLWVVIVPEAAPLNQPGWFEHQGLVINENNTSFARALTCWSKRSKVSWLQDVNVCGGGEYHIPVICPPYLNWFQGRELQPVPCLDKKEIYHGTFCQYKHNVADCSA